MSSNRRRPRTRRGGSFSDFLIDTGIKPVAVAGKAIKYFGTRLIASFLLGVFVTWAYVWFHGPYYDVLFGRTKEIKISGTLQNWTGAPMKEGRAYFAKISDKIIDGNLDTRIPKGDYKIFIVGPRSSDTTSVDVVGSNPSTFSFNAKLPPQAGSVTGRVLNTKGEGLQNRVVCISGGTLPSELCTPTDSKGSYLFATVPAFSLGLGKLIVTELSSGKEMTVGELKPYMPNSINPIVVPQNSDPTVRGTVRDRRGNPVPNIWVSIDGNGTVTSYKGDFSIDVPTSGSHTIRVIRGNITYYQNVININNNPFHYDISLPQ